MVLGWGGCGLRGEKGRGRGSPCVSGAESVRGEILDTKIRIRKEVVAIQGQTCLGTSPFMIPTTMKGRGVHAAGACYGGVHRSRSRETARSPCETSKTPRSSSAIFLGGQDAHTTPILEVEILFMAAFNASRGNNLTYLNFLDGCRLQTYLDK